MNTESNTFQLIFTYTNGQVEAFNISEANEADRVAQDLQQEMRRILEKHWWVLHLHDQTVCVNTENLLKVEIKPPLPGLHGEGIFDHARRVTALTRAHASR